jgi:hypothetical protein
MESRGDEAGEELAIRVEGTFGAGKEIYFGLNFDLD